MTEDQNGSNPGQSNPGQSNPGQHAGYADNRVFQSRYREVTCSAIIFGVVAGTVMNAAITYAGLKLGFTIGGSAIAAVLGFGVLRGMLGRGTILETNVAQTIASAVNTSNSGIIFTVPVLFLIGYELTITSLDFWFITLAGVAGAVLGTAFIIPLRKQMIDIERLRFPTGTAVASILKSPGAGPAKAVVLVVGIVVGMLIFIPTQFETLGWGEGLSHLPFLGTESKPAAGFVDDESVNAGKLLGLPRQFELIFAIAPFALGAGYLTGRAGLYVLAGGILAYFFLTPVAFAWGWMPETVTAEQAPSFGFGAFNRPLGIGVLLGGAMMGVVFSLPAIREALKSIMAAGKVEGGGEELGARTLAISVITAFILLFLTADLVGNRPLNHNCPVSGDPIDRGSVNIEYGGYMIGCSSSESAAAWDALEGARKDELLASLNARPGLLAGLNPHLRAAVIAVVGSLWIWLAGIIIAQCTGMTDWSPISGMALLTVVLVLALAGSGAVVGAVLIGAALCVAVTLAADMMQDMKTGYLVGAQPRRQQIVELALVGIGPVISMLTLILIANSNIKQGGPAFGPGTPTTAPQAQALEAVITGVQGGEMPYALYGLGALVGALLGLGAFPGLGVLVGLSMYLPFHYIATYGIGCVVNILISRWKGSDWAESWGVPFSAGLIVGESLLALVINMYILFAD